VTGKKSFKRSMKRRGKRKKLCVLREKKEVERNMTKKSTLQQEEARAVIAGPVQVK
jgi:3-deoxy-D-arabino-heptulosonate 7-phosphate (DAHP) synthase